MTLSMLLRVGVGVGLNLVVAVAVAPQARGATGPKDGLVLAVPFVEDESPGRPSRFVTRAREAVVAVEPDGTLRYGLWASPDDGLALLSERPVGGCAVTPTGVDATPTRVTRFRGPDASPPPSTTFARLSLGEAWPGIAIDVRGDGRRVEKLFTIQPGSDASSIRMRVDGARRLDVTGSGELLILAESASLAMSTPVAFQDVEGVRVDVPVAYRVDGLTYGFDMGPHDPSRAVVIDPFLQTTWFGGSGGDTIESMAVHPTTGKIYVAGSTDSADLPATTGGAQPSPQAQRDGFVARFSADLTVLEQATYFAAPGGSRADGIISLGIHPVTGDVYVAGSTFSPPPALSGGAQPSATGWFVSRLNADLTTILQSSALGTSRSQEFTVWRIGFLPGALGDVLLAGRTQSSSYAPLTAGAQGTHGDAGGFDGFVLRLNNSLTAFTGGTYIGGDSIDEVHGVGAHPVNGDVYVAGYTMSTSLAGVAGGYQTVRGGPSDAFVLRLNPALTTFVAGTLFGGPGVEDMQNNGGVPTGGLAFHPGGDVYVMAETRSEGLPETATGAIPTYQGLGGDDVFVARIAADLHSVVRATYWSPVGGSERGTDIAVDAAGTTVWLGGWSQSDQPLPASTGAPQPMLAGSFDAFVTRLKADLTQVQASTYLGGTGYDDLRAMVLHPASGDVYAAGLSQSATGLPALAGAGDDTFAGFEEGWITRLSLPLPPCPADCDGDGTVVGSEVTTARDISLGLRPLGDCPAADSDASGVVTIADVVRALLAFLTACP